MTPASRGLPVRLMPAAVDDVDVAFSYITDRNLTAARALEARLRDAVERLGEFPEMGAVLDTDAFDFVRPGTRLVVVEPYLVFYRALPEAVVILRVLHARQDSLGALFE